jgi:5-hydroxyisourate hydrolase-like protein (transthyretin family)
VRKLKYILIFLLSAIAFQALTQPANHSQLFLFADRDYCISGDTVWFKVEIRNGWRQNSNVVQVQLHSGNSGLISKVKKKSSGNWTEGFIRVPDSLSTGVYFLSAFLNSQRSASGWETVSKSLFVYNRFDEEVAQIQVPVAPKLEAGQLHNLISVTGRKETFQPREKVKVDVALNEIDTAQLKNVVIRATHIGEVSAQYGGRFVTKARSSKPSIPVIDEQNGFLLSGHVTDVTTGQPAKKVVVLLSLFDEMPYLDYYLTDDDGNFHFFLKNAFGVANAVFQTVAQTEREFNLQIDKNFLVFDPIHFETKMLKAAQKEFVANSIDGAFFKKLFGSQFALDDETFFMPPRFEYPFYGRPDYRVYPAEFFDLPNFREISRELLHGLQYRVRNSETTLRLLNEPENIYFKSDPLRLINGIPVFKNQLFAGFNSTDIEFIDLVLKERLYGDLNFKGILSVSLKDKSNAWMTQQPNFFTVRVPCMQPDEQPGYAKQTAKPENLPDIRQVNFWQLTKTGERQQIQFRLSDLKGKVEISVEGVTEDGTLMKSSKIIEVK